MKRVAKGSVRGYRSDLRAHQAEQTRSQILDATRTLEELRDGVREMFGHLDTFDDLARAAIASPAAEEARRTSMSDRLELARRLVPTIDPRLTKTDRERLARP